MTEPPGRRTGVTARLDLPAAYFIRDWLFIAGLVAGIYFYFRRRPGTEIVTLIITMNLLSIALIWSVNGRFMIPVAPGVYYLVPLSPAGDARGPIGKPLRVVARAGRTVNVSLFYPRR